MNKNIDRIRVIDPERLHSEHYFQSLLAEAQNKGLLSDRDIAGMQKACFLLLGEKVEGFNAGDSSSIQVEKAQDIMASILFTVGVSLKTWENPEDAAAALQERPICEIYQKGLKEIDSLVSTTKAVHTKLLRQLVDTENCFYRDTLADGILGFFKLYYPDYAAHEIHITVDYPLFNPIPNLAGIEFIKAYVEAACCENQFCSFFAVEDIHHLLRGYAEEYQGLLVNIYEQILTAAMGCVVAGVDCTGLDITDAGVQYLVQLFSGKSQEEILAVIAKAAEELNRRFRFSKPLAEYVKDSLPLIARNIADGAKEQILDRIFFVPAFPENKPQIIVSYGEKMDDQLYRNVIAELNQCRYTQDKLAILKEEIHSLADLEDLLLDAAFTNEELDHVLSGLEFLEVAALAKKYQPMWDNDGFGLREQEERLCMSLQRYITALPQTQQNLIEEAGKALLEE